MSRIVRLLVALSMLVVPMLALGSPAAQAADTYGSTPVASVDIKIKPDCCADRPARVDVTVSSDAAEAVGPIEGDVTVYLDGKQIKKLRFSDGSFRTTASKTFYIPFKDLTIGRHTITAEFVPDADSPYQGSSASQSFRVVHCERGELPDTGGDDDGILPDTGGFWIGLLIIALLLLAAGAYLVRRGRADAR